MKFYCVFLPVFIIQISLFSQIPNGEWRDHLPYSRGKLIEEGNSTIFCATLGGLFATDQQSLQTTKMSKVTGLSDVEFSALYYIREQELLIIGYKSGNIDLINKETIINLPDIKIKGILGDPAINKILKIGDYAYLACNFGIVVLNYNKKEIKESYFFGPNGGNIIVNDLAFDGSHIYAATDNGVYRADINANLVDYSFWERLDFLPYPEENYYKIMLFNNTLFSYYTHPEQQTEEIIIISDNTSEVWADITNTYIRNMRVYNNHLSIVSYQNIWIYDESLSLVQNFTSYYPQEAIMGRDGTIWIADKYYGLSYLNSSGKFGVVTPPNGPRYTDVGEIEYKAGHIWVAAGNNGNKFASRGAYTFSDERWTSFNYQNLSELKEFYNISEIAIDPLDVNHVFGGSVGYGVVEFKNNEFVDIYNEYDQFTTIEGYGHGYVNVKGLSYTTNGRLYAITELVNDAVYIKPPDEDWLLLDFETDNFSIETPITDILATTNNQVWVATTNHGLFVFTESDGIVTGEKRITVKNQEDDLADKIFCINEDLDGNIWLGTNLGPLVYYNPIDIFTESNPVAYNIAIPQENALDETDKGEDSEILVDFLLYNVQVNDIDFDGANRKWMATEKSGIFLLSDDGKKEIHHFTEDNSPLFSDKVMSVSVMQETGEVFVGTDKGILSYMGQSTAGKNVFDDIYVYPNPVRENHIGDITITGLIRDTNVKITDVSGNLVFETTSLGGQAIWNGKNFKGERVGTGVYIVYCATKDGSESAVTKLLFIH